MTKLIAQGIRSDNEYGFTNATIEEFLADKAIEYNISAPYTP